jgi:hypothetical protein
LKPEGAVWARKGVVSGACPKSYVTAESVGLLEEFLVRRRLGWIGLEELSARQVEAFIILEQELGGEQRSTRPGAPPTNAGGGPRENGGVLTSF